MLESMRLTLGKKACVAQLVVDKANWQGGWTSCVRHQLISSVEHLAPLTVSASATTLMAPDLIYTN